MSLPAASFTLETNMDPTRFHQQVLAEAEAIVRMATNPARRPEYTPEEESADFGLPPPWGNMDFWLGFVTAVATSFLLMLIFGG
jgi:hypothetical protein